MFIFCERRPKIYHLFILFSSNDGWGVIYSVLLHYGWFITHLNRNTYRIFIWSEHSSWVSETSNFSEHVIIDIYIHIIKHKPPKFIREQVFWYQNFECKYRHNFFGDTCVTARVTREVNFQRILIPKKVFSSEKHSTCIYGGHFQFFALVCQ